MDLILCVITNPDGSFVVIRAIKPKYYSVFIVRERPWGYEEGSLLWR